MSMALHKLIKIKSPLAKEFFLLDREFYVCGNKQEAGDAVLVTKEKINFYKDLVLAVNEEATDEELWEGFLKYWKSTTNGVEIGYTANYYIGEEYAIT